MFVLFAVSVSLTNQNSLFFVWKKKKEYGRGENDKNIKSDILARVLGFKYHANNILSQVDQQTSDILDGYSSGINTYADYAPTPFEYKVHLSSPGKKWEASDSIASNLHFYSCFLFFLGKKI